VPKFVNTNYIDLNKITKISKFRSSAGHDYHDDKESCRSMKHYFIAPDSTTTIRSPVAGKVSRLDTEFAGQQVQIVPDAQPAFVIIMFHVVLDKPLAVGDHIEEGQLLGTHAGTMTFSDIAVAVNTPTAYRLVSYFDVLTDNAFAAFQARGIQDRSDMVVSKAARDAAPYQCAGQTFINLKVAADTEYVSLTGSTAAQQTITITKGFPTTTTYLAHSPLTLSATASSGLPVTIESNTPSICTTEGMSVILLASGNCAIQFRQTGDTNTFETSTYATAYIYDGFTYPGVVAGSANVAANSFLRFMNHGSVEGTVKVMLRDSITGEPLGQWTSPPISGFGAQQVHIGQMEAGLTRQARDYTVSLQSDFLGSYQNIFYRAPDGALTNGTVCAQGVQSDFQRVGAVHSALLADYPSVVVVHNTGDAAKPAELTLFDARDGSIIGVYTTPIVPAHGRLRVSVAAMEAALGKPAEGLYHYVVMMQYDFTGFLQHIVTNRVAQVDTDLTASCSLDGTTRASPAATVRFGGVSAGVDSTTRSAFHIINQGPYAGTATFTVWDETSGQSLGQWTSPSIDGGTGRDFSVAEIESGLTLGATRPLSYAMSVQSSMFTTAIQHVTTRAADGAVVNQSLCGPNTSSDPTRVFGVRSSAPSAFQTPTAIVVTNRGSAEQTASLGIFDMRSGYLLGTYIDVVPPRGQHVIGISDLEAGAHIAPVGGDLYTVKLMGAFTGFLQHVIYNQNARILADATPYCGVTLTTPTEKFSVTTSTAGNGSGTVTVNPSSGPFAFNSAINVTAVPAPGSALLGWAGDCPSIAACVMITTRNQNAIAIFGSGLAGYSHYILNVGGTLVDGVGGTITVTGADMNCTTRGVNVSGALYVVRSGTCARPIAKGTQVTISATPARGSKFVGWSGYDCGGNGISAATTCTVMMTSNRVATAVFAAAD